MASLTDIPQAFRDSGALENFLTWLSSLSVPAHTRRELAYIWAGWNEYNFSHSQWARILAGSAEG